MILPIVAGRAHSNLESNIAEFCTTNKKQKNYFWDLTEYVTHFNLLFSLFLKVVLWRNVIIVAKFLEYLRERYKQVILWLWVNVWTFLSSPVPSEVARWTPHTEPIFTLLWDPPPLAPISLSPFLPKKQSNRPKNWRMIERFYNFDADPKIRTGETDITRARGRRFQSFWKAPPRLTVSFCPSERNVRCEPCSAAPIAVRSFASSLSRASDAEFLNI